MWGGWAGGWVSGSDGRQTCGVEVATVVLMGFHEGEGFVCGLFIALLSVQ